MSSYVIVKIGKRKVWEDIKNLDSDSDNLYDKITDNFCELYSSSRSNSFYQAFLNEVGYSEGYRELTVQDAKNIRARLEREIEHLEELYKKYSVPNYDEDIQKLIDIATKSGIRKELVETVTGAYDSNAEIREELTWDLDHSKWMLTKIAFIQEILEYKAYSGDMVIYCFE